MRVAVISHLASCKSSGTKTNHQWHHVMTYTKRWCFVGPRSHSTTSLFSLILFHQVSVSSAGSLLHGWIKATDGNIRIYASLILSILIWHCNQGNICGLCVLRGYQGDTT